MSAILFIVLTISSSPIVHCTEAAHSLVMKIDVPLEKIKAQHVNNISHSDTCIVETQHFYQVYIERDRERRAIVSRTISRRNRIPSRL